MLNGAWNDVDSISEEQFLSKCKEAFPQIVIKDGFHSNRDEFGNPFITLAIGGAKRAGEEFICIWRTAGMEIWDYWWREFKDWVTSDVKQICIRQYPKLHVWEESSLDTFSSTIPRITTRDCAQITGRFTFVKNTGESQNG